MNIIYALYCPDKYKPVYVGQSNNGLNRPFTHIKEKSHSDLVNEWVKNLKDTNKQPILVILEKDFEEKNLNEKEQLWVTKLVSEGHLLLNRQLINEKAEYKHGKITPVRLNDEILKKIKNKLDDMPFKITVSKYIRSLIVRDLEL